MDLFARFRKQYHSLNTIEVSKKALVHNYKYLNELTDLTVAPVFKSNAYGHGFEIAKILDKVKAPFFCVDSIYEAYELLKQGVKTPILIMGYVDPRNLKVKKLPFMYAISTKEMLDAVSKYQPDASVHVFVDTGMHREGVPMEELASFIEILRAKKHLKVDGLMAHFAASDNFNDLTQLQVKNFQIAQALFKTAGFNLKWIHHANSSALLNYKNYKGKIGNVARVGIALSGNDPEAKNKKIKPTLQFISTIAQIKDLAKGESTGYDFTFTAKNDMRIAVVPAGYNDGVDRRLSNLGCMKVGKTDCPIIGRVSMNLTMINISNGKNIKVGDKVVIYSHDSQDKNSVAKAAAICKTIPYDLLVKLANSTKRVMV